MVEPFHYLYAIVGTWDVQLGRFFAGLATAVDGNQEVVAAAFHIKRNFPVVTNDDGTDVEAVWSHRGDGNGFTVGHNDRTADAEWVGGGTGRCGDN